jgi:Glycosyl transferase family 2
MAAKPFVSAVICCYNYGRYVGQAIDSALAQKYPADRYEVIVVDDGSTDDTPEVVARYGDRIRSIRQENAGVLAATSAGIAAARGEFIAPLDADDRWLPTAVPTLAAALRRDPQAALVQGDLRVVDDSDRVVHGSYRELAALIDGPCSIRGQLVNRCRVNTNAMMFRRELVLPHLPFETPCPYQDWWIALVLSRAGRFIAVPDVLALYRNHASNFVLGTTASGGVRRELPFRRWMLCRPDELAEASPVELQQALLTFDYQVGVLARGGVAELEELVPVDAARLRAADAALQAASDALDAARVQDAAAALAGAAAHNPFADAPRELLSQLVSLTTDAQLAAA